MPELRIIPGSDMDDILQWAHITQSSLNLLYTPTAVMIGMIYEFLPFMILPLYSSLEKIEFSLLEAARIWVLHLGKSSYG